MVLSPITEYFFVAKNVYVIIDNFSVDASVDLRRFYKTLKEFSQVDGEPTYTSARN